MDLVSGGLLDDPGTWLAFGASLGIGLLIGIERERNPAAKAGLRTFALIALLGTLAALVGERAAAAWVVPLGLAAVAGTLIAAYAREADPGATTVVAGTVCYLLGVLAGLGEAPLAGALAIGVAALLYFKPELKGFSSALSRQDLVSMLQFLVVTFIVLPILPDRAYGPYGVLNPQHVWLMVVLISGVSIASYVALRFAGERHGVLVTGILGGLVSSTATTVLYARRAAESTAMERMALAVVLIANLVPLARVAAVAAVVQPSILGVLAPPLIAALVAGLGAVALTIRRLAPGAPLSIPEIRNPAELGTALKFGALYAVVLVAAAWLADLAGSRGLYAAALATGFIDVDPVVLSALNLHGAHRVNASAAVVAIALALAANTGFKLAVMGWLGGWHFARRAAGPLGAAAAGGAAVLWLA